jgi:hypothetical protein
LVAIKEWSKDAPKCACNLGEGISYICKEERCKDKVQKFYCLLCPLNRRHNQHTEDAVDIKIYFNEVGMRFNDLKETIELIFRKLKEIWPDYGPVINYVGAF